MTSGSSNGHGPLAKSRTRKQKPPAWVIGETASERTSRITEWVTSRVRPFTESLPDGAPTAQERFAQLIKSEIAPQLRIHGFKGSGRSYRIDRGDLRGQLNFQGSRWNTKAEVEFTINLSAAHHPLPTPRGWWSRIGHLLPEQNDTWWVLPARANTDELREDVLDAILSYGLIALEAALQELELAIDASKKWPRTFKEPEAGDDYSEPVVLPHERPLPRDLDELFRILNEEPSSNTTRWWSWLAYEAAPHDPRLLPLLMRILESDPNSYARSSAALQLAFGFGGQETAIAALRSSAAEDEELQVRIAARYAVALSAGDR